MKSRTLLSMLVGLVYAPMYVAEAAPSAAVAKKDDAQTVKMENGWLAHKVEVSKKVSVGPDKNEYSKVGDVVIPLPTLESFGIDAKIKEIGEDGLPVYEKDEMDWLFGAIVASAKMQARNKLISGTADLKDGQKIASTFEELTAEGERRGNAEALKLAKEVQVSFSSYVQGLGKTIQTQAMLTGLFRNKQALALQPDSAKEKMKGYVTAYAETLSETDLERYSKYLASVEEACTAGAPTDF